LHTDDFLTSFRRLFDAPKEAEMAEEETATTAPANTDPSITRVTLRLGPEAMKTLEWLKERRGVSTLSDVFRHAIGTEKFLFDRQDSGEDIILENRETGKQRIFHMR
jgi:hypothetical protein